MPMSFAQTYRTLIYILVKIPRLPKIQNMSSRKKVKLWESAIHKCQIDAFTITFIRQKYSTLSLRSPKIWTSPWTIVHCTRSGTTLPVPPLPEGQRQDPTPPIEVNVPLVPGPEMPFCHVYFSNMLHSGPWEENKRERDTVWMRVGEANHDQIRIVYKGYLGCSHFTHEA